MMSIKVSCGNSCRLTATTPNGHRSVTSHDGAKSDACNFASAAVVLIAKHGLSLDLGDARLAIVPCRGGRIGGVFAFERGEWLVADEEMTGEELEREADEVFARFKRSRVAEQAAHAAAALAAAAAAAK